jgi:hypothetical protein
MAAPAWAVDLKATVTTLTTTVVALSETVHALTATVHALAATVDANHAVVLSRLDKLDARVDSLDERVAKLDARVARVETSVQSLAAARANDVSRLANALKACEAPLVPLRFRCDGRPWPSDVEQPATLLDLAVSGAEAKPGTSTRANWNKERSRAFLQVAVDGYATDGSDAEGEIGAKARTARVKVIQAMGGDVAAVLATTYKFT